MVANLNSMRGIYLALVVVMDWNEEIDPVCSGILGSSNYPLK